MDQYSTSRCIKRKTLLPVIPPKLGQLHFVSALKWDILGLVCSTLQKSFAYILQEGKWPYEKTADTEVSMLQNTIVKYKKKHSMNKLLRNLSCDF